MIRLSDYVIDFLVKKGISDIFLVSGGGIMYLTDSVGRKMKYISNYHEQAAATAAESYARFKNDISACLVTTGPGSTNAITGVAGAWVDSVPILVLSGQVKREAIADYSKLRQQGPQEINTLDLVKPITKYAVTVMDPANIKYVLEKAFYEAKNDRQGPVWINIPLDVQGSIIDEKKLVGFELPHILEDRKYLAEEVEKVIYMLKESERPVIIGGFGIRLSGGYDVLQELILKLKIPIIVDSNGLDLTHEDNDLSVGRYGPLGQRRANFALQNADLVLAIGASLNIASTGFEFDTFAPKAKKIMVNVDKNELTKSTIKINLPIESDAKKFMEELLLRTKKIEFTFSKKWYQAIKQWKRQYKNIIPEFYTDTKHVNSCVFFDKLSKIIDSKIPVLTGVGQDVVSFSQAFKVKKNQRAYNNKNFGQMGWCLPGAIGACVANGRRETILVTGDGSIQFNLHELATIRYYNLPIKIFVFNNRGYKSIRDSQNNFFEGRLVGADITSGVICPNLKSLAKAYNLHYDLIKNNRTVIRKVRKALILDGPTLFEVNINPEQPRIPRISNVKKSDGTMESRPLEDMLPFLPREELYKNMHMFDK